VGGEGVGSVGRRVNHYIPHAGGGESEKNGVPREREVLECTGGNGGKTGALLDRRKKGGGGGVGGWRAGPRMSFLCREAGGRGGEEIKKGIFSVMSVGYREKRRGGKES